MDRPPEPLSEEMTLRDFAARLTGLLDSRTVAWGVTALIVLLCAIGNLPWHLDNYDQAKQAFVSWEMATGGDFWFQHTPRGGVATKPPLAGWISLGTFQIFRNWDLAWRLPGFLCALALLGLLLREGRRLMPAGGALLAACAFGLNLLTPRIATLVRTDMMLAFFISVCGLVILRVVQRGEGWTPRERWIFFGGMTASLLTKGPILYAFLIPGMLAFALLAPRNSRRLVWGGWGIWLIPLALFLAWGIAGILTRADFYDQVVVREFLSRFDEGLRGGERHQPLWFYFPHLIHKFLPWSLFLIVLPCVSRNVRSAIRRDPGLLWLACWGLGGLLFMTCVPSKRVDRIFPVIPPLALLLVGMVAACRCGTRVRAWCGAGLVAAVLFSGGYFLGIVVMGYKDGNDALVRFGRQAATLAAGNGAGRLAVVSGRDEGLLLYAGQPRFLHPDRAARLWDGNEIEALLIPERRLREKMLDQTLDLPKPTLISRETPNGERHLLFLKKLP